ncbi:hypothetical protein AAVH_13964 [Aphelenchoides avenae]|nr:hypothetical protein AAVH_13964 [Aphelenchus avenae]
MFDALPVEVLRDAFGWLHVFELDNCGFVTRRWKDIIDSHGDELPHRHFKTFELELDHHKVMRLEREPVPEGVRKVSLKNLKYRSHCLDRLKNVDLSSFTAVCPEHDGNTPGDFVNLRITYDDQNDETLEIGFRCSSVVADAPESALEVLHWFSHSADAFYDEDRVRAKNLDWYAWNLWDVGHDAEETDEIFFDLVLNSSFSVTGQLVLIGWVIGEGVIDRLIKASKFLTEDLRPVPRIFIDLPVYNGHTIPQPAACDESARVKEFPTRIRSKVQNEATRTCYSFKNASGLVLDTVELSLPDLFLNVE